MCDDWTIDSNILYKYCEVDSRAIELLSRIERQKQFIILDIEGHIESEYRSCFFATNGNTQAITSLKKWFSKIRKRKFSNHLAHSIKVDLLEMRFHDNDLPYVGVCINSNGKRIVTEDSDYNTIIEAYLSNIGISVLTCEEALYNGDS